MAIIKCPNCGQEVSDQDESCRCGLLVCNIIPCPTCGQFKMKSAVACNSCGYTRPKPPKNITSKTTVAEDVELLADIADTVLDIVDIVSILKD
ncbi:MAG: hypothetical protein ACM3PP_00555 [Candidatus Saccharibacteria bacterium]